MSETEKSAEDTLVVSDNFLTAEEIIGVDDRPWYPFDVPEWGGKVRIRAITVEEYERLAKLVMTLVNGDQSVSKGSVQAKYLAVCLCDEQGNRIFSEQDIAKLAKKCGAVVERIFKFATSVNSSKGVVETLEKNFVKTISD